MLEQVAVVVHEQDAVAHGDPEQRDEAHQARDREHRRRVRATSEEAREVLETGSGDSVRKTASTPTDQGQRQVHQHEQRDPQRADREVEQHEHDEQRRRR